MPSADKTAPGIRRVDVYLPAELAAKLEGLLRSDTVGRIPKGSLNAFMVARVNEFFAQTRLPLGQYAGFHPGDWAVGPHDAVARVAAALAPLRREPEGMDDAFPELRPPVIPGSAEPT